ncbi:MAG: WD40/YVTN/BNR-like repeat-containing protein [Phycisphaerae bacterium]
MSDRIFLATRKGLFTVQRTGNGACGWEITRAAFEGDYVGMMLPDPRDGSLYAALGHGHFGIKLHKSTDDGVSWSEIAAPALPKTPDGAEPVLDMWGKPVPDTVMDVWSLEGGGPDQPGLLWCGTIPGGLFKSTDAGQSWELVRSLWDHPGRRDWFGGGADWPGIHSICVDPRDSNRVTLGVSCGGVWITTDGGETWECKADGMWAAYMPPDQKHKTTIQDPHRVVQCRTQPDKLWAQHHNGIFRTVDGCDSWQEIKEAGPSTFGFAVVVHPADGETAWFIPAISDEHRIPADGKVLVTRTRDGGRSFDVLTQGLPAGHAYDLVFRHALDIDETGNRLVFGSTTGSVWLSEDQGDTWRCLSNNLPPVYGARFAK